MEANDDLTCFFVRLRLFAMLAELFQLKTRLDLFVLLRVVVHLFANGAFQLDEVILGHRCG